jgi:predicted nucleic-acid-binding protein
MIGLDTNVLVRYFVQDDEEQARAAGALIESHCTADDPGAVSLVVLCELVWILDRGYGYAKDIIAGVLRRMLSVEDLRVERFELARLALNRYENGKADFADYVIALCHRELGAAVTLTFDRRTSGCELFEQAARQA